MTQPVTSGGYRADVDLPPPISREEEQELALQAQAGDAGARDKLIASNLRWVVQVARRYEGGPVPIDDLVQEGNLALIRSVDDFDPERQLRLISFATHRIRATIQRAVARETKRLGREVPLEDLSPEAPSGADPLDLHRDTTETGPLQADEQVEQKDLIRRLRAALDDQAVLTKREAQVLCLNFGIGQQPPLGLDEVGRRLGFSRRWAQALRQRALTKLRHSSHGRTLQYLWTDE